MTVCFGGHRDFRLCSADRALVGRHFGIGSLLFSLVHSTPFFICLLTPVF